ncbi:restriction endonuclease [Candidatus Campbellbacteria bacterium]|nr:MAG: restriction endonuclease [Candidatus Campbellbacteria bacterium]
MLISKLDGTLEEFSPGKLARSLKNAGASDDVTADIITHVEKELHEGMTTSHIYTHALKLLQKQTLHPIAARYSLRRAVLELGPSGYPFEQLLGEVFKKKGYDVRVGATMQGKCVSHEIDVIAKKEKELILVEAKFHNAQGFKTDVKVSLYIYARMLDLQAGNYDGLCPPGGLCHQWLVTNTKFTDNAIAHGKCVGITLIGWGYPHTGNVQDLIEETRLHPLSCLTSLSKKEKDALYQQNIVLCKNIVDNPNILETAGITGKKVDTVLSEAHQLCTL